MRSEFRRLDQHTGGERGKDDDVLRQKGRAENAQQSVEKNGEIARKSLPGVGDDLLHRSDRY